MVSSMYRLGPERLKRFEALVKDDRTYARWMRKFTNEVTQYNYFRWLIPLCDHLSLQPQDIVEQYKTGGEIRDSLLDKIEEYLHELKQRSVAQSKNAHAALASFLMHNGAIMSAANFEIPSPKSEVIRPQYIPTDDEFETMLRFAQKSRDKFLLVYFRYSGARIGTLEDPRPPTLRNVLDLDLGGLSVGKVEFKFESSCALLIYGEFEGEEVVRTADTYIGFMPRRGMHLLTEYLEGRLRQGEKLTAESPLFKNDCAGTLAYLYKGAAVRQISRISKAAGFTRKDGKAKFTAHSLRRLFYNSLTGIDDVDREALMGHVKGVRARYHGTVDDLKRAVEFMRQKYEIGMRAVMGMTDEENRMRSLVDFARTLGVSEERITKIQTALGHTATLDQLREALGEELGFMRTARNGGTPNAYESKIISEKQVLVYVNNGWEVLQPLSDSKFLIRKPVK
jgi:hypothetical protein